VPVEVPVEVPEDDDPEEPSEVDGAAVVSVPLLPVGLQHRYLGSTPLTQDPELSWK